jgi:hypothetical protein
MDRVAVTPTDSQEPEELRSSQGSAAPKGFRRFLVSPVMACLLAACISVGAVVLRLNLWGPGLSLPVSYRGDALYEMVYVSGLKQNAWNNYIPRLGAPFGMDTVDWPIGRSLDYAIVKLLSFFARDAFILVNLYWLTAIALAGAFATLLLRYLSVGRVWAITFGVLYAIVPFTFFRNIGHLALVHFVVPGAGFLGLLLAEGKPLGLLSFLRARRPSRGWVIPAVAVLAAVAAGMMFPYWAFFASICVAIGCYVGFVRTRSAGVVVSAMALLVILALAKVLDLSPSLLHWHYHGKSTALQFRNVAEADTYGLTIRQMLTPIVANPVPLLRSMNERISAAAFPHDQNESSAAALGTFAGIGFLLLVLVAIGQPKGRFLGDSRIRSLSAFVIAMVLIAEVGGFGSLFNVFVLREFRTYNRISPFIALFSLAAVAVVMDLAFRRIRTAAQCCLAGSIIVFAVFDQIPRPLFRRIAVDERFNADHKFFAELEARLPQGAMIFQLPNTPLPPQEHFGTMEDYDNTRPYLHSQTLRWSWGTMVGRFNDWPASVALLPPADFLQQIALAGFEGILLNRHGYPDRAKENQIREQLGPGSEFDSGDEWIFFDLRDFRKRALQGLSPEEIKQRQKNLFSGSSLRAYKLGTGLTFGRGGSSERFKSFGWSGTEAEFTWTEGRSAGMQFSGIAPGSALTLKVKLRALTSDSVSVFANDRKIAEWHPTDSPMEYVAPIAPDTIAADQPLEIKFVFSNPVSPKALGMGADARLLGICVYALAITPDK